MAGYKPLYVKGVETGLVQSRQEFILPNDAYPTLENAFIFREKILRRQGLQFQGRLQRNLQSGTVLSVTTGAGTIFSVADIFADASFNIRATQPNAQIVPTSVDITVSGGGGVYLDSSTGNGVLTSADGSGTINYSTGALTINFNVAPGAGQTVTVKINYYPMLPVMGIRTQELLTTSIQDTIVFDTIYAYKYNGTNYDELASTAPTTWQGSNSNFFFTTNYWTNANGKLFWATNYNVGISPDPIRYYDSITWTDFAPTVNAGGDKLQQCLALLPFRGRLLAFNTYEGANLPGSTPNFQRIRWSQIGDPTAQTTAWRDDVRGKGGFLDIPTSENITAVGFVRDNLVIYCERSTWQLRYTGLAVAPFQIERVNSELGAYSAFSAVQFDRTLVGIGDKGVVECDSYQSKRIDIKIPDLVFLFSGDNDARLRIQGIRDIQQRVAYWTYVDNSVAEQQDAEGGDGTFPNRRLVYNYENDSWAIFTDSLTALGSYNEKENNFTWQEADWTWAEADYPWNTPPTSFPSLLGGNQQGFVMYLSSNLEPQTSNDITLAITNITGNTTTPTVITSPNHNLVTGQVISISDIPTGTAFASSLNDNKFGIVVTDANNFQLWVYDSSTQEFSTPQLDSTGIYVGFGNISVRDGIDIVSKQFNFLDNGQNIQMGYVDLLMNATDGGAITMNVYLNYNNQAPINTLPQNMVPSTSQPDPFFNSTVPTTASSLGGMSGQKYWQRVYCPVRGSFIQLEFTLSNAQLIDIEQETEFQMDSQILWLREAGRLQTW